jgi:predicted dithiol-disulfide oxidoreductase (DUF899 family)
MNLPEVVSEQEWRRAHDGLWAKEKALMREGDRLAAERRRQPMHEMIKDYRFEGSDGEVSLLDLFDGRRQLALYHFMFGPSRDEGCDGCSMFVDQLTHLAHLHARDTSFVLVSRAPLTKLRAFKRRMGGTRSRGTPTARATSAWTSASHPPCRSPTGTRTARCSASRCSSATTTGAFFRSYFTHWRGVEAIGSVWSILDRTPLGRQEEWEDTPEGRPQGPKYGWWRLHDRYESSRHP